MRETHNEGCVSVPLRSSEGYTGKWRWENGQPVRHSGTVEEQIKAYRSNAAERLEQFRQTIDEITKNLGFRVEIIGPCLKSEESCVRKAWDRTTNKPGNPQSITDFGRATKTVPQDDKQGVQHLQKVIDRVMNDPSLAAYKDQFFEPNEETGFRSFKGLLDMDGHRFELLIKYGGMDEADKATESIRETERNLRDGQIRLANQAQSMGDKAYQKFSGEMEGAIEILRMSRRIISDDHATRCGLDVLLSPAARERNLSALSEDFLRGAEAAATRSHFSEPLQRALKLVASGGAQFDKS